MVPWAALTDVGRRRPHNEDAWAVWSLGPGSARRVGPDQAYPLSGDGDLLLVVADGIGGSLAGEVASAFCVERLAGEVAGPVTTDPVRHLRGAVLATHHALVARSRTNEDWTEMGATLSALWLRAGGSAVLGHVGDSRIYRGRIGATALEQLTDDHSVAASMVRRGELTAEAARRLRVGHVLEQAMGGEGTVLDPQVEAFTWTPGDTFLLCSDGLHGVAPEAALAGALRADAADFPAAVVHLIEAANDAGGPDNITAVLARLESTG